MGTTTIRADEIQVGDRIMLGGVEREVEAVFPFMGNIDVVTVTGGRWSMKPELTVRKAQDGPVFEHPLSDRIVLVLDPEQALALHGALVVSDGGGELRETLLGALERYIGRKRP